MDTNILIRTFMQEGNRLRFRAGAGIVIDSQPERELQETRHKARGLLRALGLEESGSSSPGGHIHPGDKTGTTQSSASAHAAHILGRSAMTTVWPDRHQARTRRWSGSDRSLFPPVFRAAGQDGYRSVVMLACQSRSSLPSPKRDRHAVLAP